MKTSMLLAVVAKTFLTWGDHGRLAALSPAADTVSAGHFIGGDGLTDEQLDNLVAPIALYPDSVVALVLDASQHLSALVAAGDFLSKGPDRGAPDPTWPASITALLKYPSVLTMLDNEMSWTARLGNAEKADPARVQQAIQCVRTKARSAGNLMSNQYQTVKVVNNVIEIVPASPDVVYIPSYNSSAVYVAHPAAAPLLTFGAGVALGAAAANYHNDYYHSYYNHIYAGGAVHYGGAYGGGYHAAAVTPYGATSVSHHYGPYGSATHVGHAGAYGYSGATHVGNGYAGMTHVNTPGVGGATFGHVGGSYGGFGHGFNGVGGFHGGGRFSGGGGFHFHGR